VFPEPELVGAGAAARGDFGVLKASEASFFGDEGTGELFEAIPTERGLVPVACSEASPSVEVFPFAEGFDKGGSPTPAESIPSAISS
jgi:hypothetical protein